MFGGTKGAPLPSKSAPLSKTAGARPTNSTSTLNSAARPAQLVTGASSMSKPSVVSKPSSVQTGTSSISRPMVSTQSGYGVNSSRLSSTASTPSLAGQTQTRPMSQYPGYSSTQSNAPVMPSAPRMPTTNSFAASSSRPTGASFRGDPNTLNSSSMSSSSSYRSTQPVANSGLSQKDSVKTLTSSMSSLKLNANQATAYPSSGTVGSSARSQMTSSGYTTPATNVSGYSSINRSGYGTTSNSHSGGDQSGISDYSGISSGVNSASNSASVGVGSSPSSHGSNGSTSPKELIRFQLGDLDVSTTVGTGTFGRVRIARHKPTDQWFALKIMKKAEIIRLKQVEHIKSEAKILGQVNHPFIVNLRGIRADPKRLYMLFEFVPGGELFSHLRYLGKLTNEAARFYASQISLAFEYLHSSNIVYRDLKPENLLLTAVGNVKIADFGFAKVVHDRTFTLCGTPEYLAPEIIQSKGHNKGVDWWALGILIYEMLAGYPPFSDDNAYGIYQKILAGKIEWPRHFSVEARDLVRRLLTPDRTKRLGCMFGGAKDIKEHQWFAGTDWNAVFNCTLIAPHIPTVKAAHDTSNFDEYPESDGDTALPLSARDADLFVEFD